MKTYRFEVRIQLFNGEYTVVMHRTNRLRYAEYLAGKVASNYRGYDVRIFDNNVWLTTLYVPIPESKD